MVVLLYLFSNFVHVKTFFFILIQGCLFIWKPGKTLNLNKKPRKNLEFLTVLTCSVVKF